MKSKFLNGNVVDNRSMNCTPKYVLFSFRLDAVMLNIIILFFFCIKF